MQEQDIDIQLWSYIDGTADNAERERIAALINSDVQWKEQYDELLAFHASLNNELKPAQVTAGFTNAVMDRLPAPAAKKASLSLVYTWGIRAVGIFFIAVLGWLLTDAIFAMQFVASESTTDILPEFNFNINIPKINSSTVAYAGFVVLILLLLTADKLFRSRARHHL